MNNLDPKKETDTKNRASLMADLSHGMEFALTAILGMALGYWLGKKWHYPSAGLVIGLFSGAILGTINIARKLK